MDPFVETNRSSWERLAYLLKRVESSGLRSLAPEDLEDLGRLYLEQPSLWRGDPDPESFRWIDCHDTENVVLSYLRQEGAEMVLVVLNLTPLPREGYRIGAPRAGAYRLLLSSDAEAYGGSQVPDPPQELRSEALACHGWNDSLCLTLPPLGALILKAPAHS